MEKNIFVFNIGEIKIWIHQMRTEYINKGDKSFHQKAVNFCNGGWTMMWGKMGFYLVEK